MQFSPQHALLCILLFESSLILAITAILRIPTPFRPREGLTVLLPWGEDLVSWLRFTPLCWWKVGLWIRGPESHSLGLAGHGAGSVGWQPHEYREFCLFHSLKNPQHLEQCLAANRCSKNICWINDSWVDAVWHYINMSSLFLFLGIFWWKVEIINYCTLYF